MKWEFVVFYPKKPKGKWAKKGLPLHIIIIMNTWRIGNPLRAPVVLLPPPLCTSSSAAIFESSKLLCHYQLLIIIGPPFRAPFARFLGLLLPPSPPLICALSPFFLWGGWHAIFYVLYFLMPNQFSIMMRCDSIRLWLWLIVNLFLLNVIRSLQFAPRCIGGKKYEHLCAKCRRCKR